MLTIFGRPVFLLLNSAGVVLLLLSQVLPNLFSIGSATVGSAFLTIGITLPVALYFQMQSNAEAFKILNTCSTVGIESIFISRKRDANDLREAIAEAMPKSNTVSLLGIAFRTFSDPSAESREDIIRKINSPSTYLRVLLLDPESDAAIRRAKIEFGNATIDNIKYTLDNNLVAIATERLRQVQVQSKSEDNVPQDSITENNFVIWREKLNMEVRTYKFEPVVFLMIFDNTMFSEQYHRGRPDEFVPIGSCIGKYMPVVQYRQGCTGYQFLEQHFETLWNEATDQTNSIMKKAFSYSYENDIKSHSVIQTNNVVI
ncbi:MAG: hypothetical protein K8R41_12750 [Bacteroidales bacterium]|nr:hypothetical protein [Bacteroidales bacterium]